MKINCRMLALSIILVPNCLLAAERHSFVPPNELERRSEIHLDLSEDVEAHWGDQHKSFDWSASQREARQSGWWQPLNERALDIGQRRDRKKSRRSWTSD
jgi:hypothetical protein